MEDRKIKLNSPRFQAEGVLNLLTRSRPPFRHSGGSRNPGFLGGGAEIHETKTGCRPEFILSDRLCENSIGALRLGSGRADNYLILLTLQPARGEALEP